jgi:uncharacterized membrane protein required for colicin V production
MTWIDLMVIALVALYVIVGYSSGVVRRVLGLLIVYGAFFVATYMGSRGGEMLVQARPGTPSADARIYAYFGFLVLVVVVVEGLAMAYRDLLQISVVGLDKFTGALVGGLTGLAIATLSVYLLGASANPLGGSLDGLQLTIKDGVTNSLLTRPLLRTLGPPLRFLFLPALPNDPQLFFEKG